jgi:hypothetical protein
VPTPNKKSPDLKSGLFILLLTGRAIAVDIQLMSHNGVASFTGQPFFIAGKRTMFDGQNLFTAQTDQIMAVNRTIVLIDCSAVAGQIEF